MTLDRVEIDLPAAFLPGQAYVAFSRVKGLKGLIVRKFEEKSVFTTSKVRGFYEGLGREKTVL